MILAEAPATKGRPTLVHNSLLGQADKPGAAAKRVLQPYDMPRRPKLPTSCLDCRGCTCPCIHQRQVLLAALQPHKCTCLQPHMSACRYMSIQSTEGGPTRATTVDHTQQSITPRIERADRLSCMTADHANRRHMNAQPLNSTDQK